MRVEVSRNSVRPVLTGLLDYRATGVTTAMVEGMEQSFKKDVLRELRAGDGRILLHDEVEERPGVFSIIPLWETASEDDILTPRDVFDRITKEGYKVIQVLSTSCWCLYTSFPARLTTAVLLSCVISCCSN